MRSAGGRSTPRSSSASRRSRVLRSGETKPADRRAARPARQRSSRGCGPGLRPWRGDVLGGVRPADCRLADRSDARAARRRIGRRADRPGAADWMDSLTDTPSRIVAVTHPAGDPGGDSGGPRCAAEVVLAHRYCAGEPHGDAFSRPRVDAAVTCDAQRSSRRASAEHLLGDRHQPAPAVGPWKRGQFNWKLTTHGWPVRSTAYQLNVRSPGRFPALAPMYGHFGWSRSMPGIADRSP